MNKRIYQITENDAEVFEIMSDDGSTVEVALSYEELFQTIETITEEDRANGEQALFKYRRYVEEYEQEEE